MTLRVGTRGSALATAQAGDVARAITAATGIPTELVLVTTHGDTSRESLASLGGTGVFASALREAMLAGECDLVVHSMKDLPTAAYPGLVIGAVPSRADARDALCARDGMTLADLPEGARVGTGSPRRAAQLRARRPDLEVVDIRGNVDTRLGFVSAGELDAVVLAAAGLSRLGRSEVITELFDLETWPTAPAQGALAIEVRVADLEPTAGAAASERSAAAEGLRTALTAVNDSDAYAAAAAERGVLAGLDAGCAAPVGAHARVSDMSVTVVASVYSVDGARSLTDELTAELGAARTPDFSDSAVRAMIKRSEHAGNALADALLVSGAAALAPLRR
ncbi:hydroxymethylbilane synthase [Okibacterium endophyticum]